MSISSNRPLVSVIVPTHNRAALVVRAINSVLYQSYYYFELIIVDDCSVDNTEDVVLKIRDDRIKYFKHTVNKGGSAARNTGIGLARGDYITFLDDDDIYMKRKIEKQLDLINDYDVIICGWSLSDGRQVRPFQNFIIQSKDLKRGRVIGGGSSVIFGKADVIRGTLFDESLPCRQDWDFLVRIAMKYRIKCIKDALVLYNNSEHSRISNESRGSSIADLERRLVAFYKHKDFLGSFWFNFRTAQTLLSYFRHRDKRFSHFVYTLKRCGFCSVGLYVCLRMYQKFFQLFLKRFILMRKGRLC